MCVPLRIINPHLRGHRHLPQRQPLLLCVAALVQRLLRQLRLTAGLGLFRRLPLEKLHRRVLEGPAAGKETMRLAALPSNYISLRNCKVSRQFTSGAVVYISEISGIKRLCMIGDSRGRQGVQENVRQFSSLAKLH